MSDWYIRDPKGLEGPYSLNHLKTMLQDGDLSPEDQVQQGREGTLQTIHDVPELASAASIASESREARTSARAGGDSNVVIWVVVLVVLVVVLVCGGLLAVAAMMFPAVNEVRAVARRVQSQEHLRNIAIAMHNYESDHGTFPPGGFLLADGTEWHGWGTYLLPYLENDPLYTSMDVDNRGWTDPAVQPLLFTGIDTYRNPMAAEWQDSAGRSVSHYAANQHLLGENLSHRIADITDGTSFTLAFGEIGAGYLTWASARNYRDPAKGLAVSADQFSDPEGMGAQFSFADGRVQTLDASLDPNLLRQLAQPADGSSVTIP